MNVSEQIDESTRRAVVRIMEECGISSKRHLKAIAARVKEALRHEHRLEEESERIRDGYFQEAWFAVASLKGVVAVLEEEAEARAAGRFHEEAEALKDEIVALARTAERLTPRPAGKEAA